jgi:acetolactate synthase small subunit
MAATIEKIVCKFVGDFEVADNIVRNGDALCKLSAANENLVFNKLMVIQASSIVEAGLDQIIYRAQNYNREGVPNISEEDRLAIAATTVEKFNNIIQTMKKYKILDELGTSRNEWTAFSNEIVAWALASMHLSRRCDTLCRGNLLCMGLIL